MTAASVRFVEQPPEAGRGWIAFRPARWPLADRPWIDLATGRLEAGRVPVAGFPDSVAWPKVADDIVYLPPVAVAYRPARDALVASAARDGIPCLVQVLPGEAVPPAAVLAFVDLTAAVLAGEMARLDEVPAGGHVLWPLIPGIGDDAELIAAGIERLARGGASTARGIAVEIAPTLRQRLAEGRPAEVFDALFRGAATTEPALAEIASAHGLGLWPGRPATGATARVRQNRRIAGKLAETAELWLALGRSEAAGQLLWRASRRAEASAYDLFALGREGNLGVLDWLDERAREVAEAVVRGDEPALLRAVRAAFVGAS